MDDGAPDPETMIGDKGYDSDPIRDDLEERGAEPVIPTKANRKVQRPVDRKTYSLRNRIERFFNKIKNSRRVATRYDKLASSFLGFVQLATIRIWIRFVHAAGVRPCRWTGSCCGFDQGLGVLILEVDGTAVPES